MKNLVSLLLLSFAIAGCAATDTSGFRATPITERWPGESVQPAPGTVTAGPWVMVTGVPVVLATWGRQLDIAMPERKF